MEEGPSTINNEIMLIQMIYKPCIPVLAPSVSCIDPVASSSTIPHHPANASGFTTCKVKEDLIQNAHLSFFNASKLVHRETLSLFGIPNMTDNGFELIPAANPLDKTVQSGPAWLLAPASNPLSLSLQPSAHHHTHKKHSTSQAPNQLSP